MSDELAKARILVVDDEQGMRDMLSFELGNEGFKVVCAESGSRAVEIAKNQEFDIVITDLKMPGMDGMVTLVALKTIDPTLEVIVATGYATIDTAIACMKQGAYDYIQKPFDLTELRLVIDRALEQRRLRGMVSLYQASQVLVSTLNQDELIQLALEMAQRLHNASAVGLVLKSQGPGRLDSFCLSETRKPSDELLQKLAAASLAAGNVIRRSASDKGFAESCASEGFHSCLAIPLVVREEIRGTLVLLREPAKPPFSASEQQTSSVFATQLALSLENARLVGELEDRVSELVATRDKLVQAEKMALAGLLAGAVAHEVNNPLGYIRANLSAVKEYFRDFGRAWEVAKKTAAEMQGADDQGLTGFADRILEAGGIGQTVIDEQMQDLPAILEECREGIGRIADLVSDFAQLSRPRESPRDQQVDLAQVMQNSIDAPQRSQGTGHRQVKLEVEKPPPVRASQADLESAMSHLIRFLLASRKNGASASPEPILVRVRESTGRPVVELTDPDLFLSDEERTSIFDPSIEADRTGGTMRLNIGLAIAHQLLQANGADLGVESDKSGGTTIRILLNRMD